MTGSSARGMLLDGDLSSHGYYGFIIPSHRLTELHDSIGDEMGLH